MHAETYRELLDPSFLVRGTKRDLHQGWLGVGCKTDIGRCQIDYVSVMTS